MNSLVSLTHDLYLLLQIWSNNAGVQLTIHYFPENRLPTNFVHQIAVGDPLVLLYGKVLLSYVAWILEKSRRLFVGSSKKKNVVDYVGSSKSYSFLGNPTQVRQPFWRLRATYVLPKLNGFVRSFAFTGSIKQNLDQASPI